MEEISCKEIAHRGAGISGERIACGNCVLPLKRRIEEKKLVFILPAGSAPLRATLYFVSDPCAPHENKFGSLNFISTFVEQYVKT